MHDSAARQLYIYTGMLVDVVQMRVAGVKIEPMVVRRSAATRGHLSIVRQEGGNTMAQAFCTAYFTVLVDYSSQQLLPALHRANVSRMMGDQFVVVGEQEVREGVAVYGFKPQAWWCRIVR
ncbi:hypothetical protein OOT46_29130 [Aquabacterium sp. A7-Y]|uniref:hypothetical protein n=1 Tax=Aquabacterium sp. A7-Y TaxID=1349605 RepID=UPI00223E84D3|nr:hypothetical protein [Aquabacterium sp. A7-Y]MCW7541865.1 hypothetical protein [Aquabacterium sp. A7-Y]